MQDNNFYSLLESSKWLKFISYCLEKASEATSNLKSGTSVILQGKYNLFFIHIYCHGINRKKNEKSFKIFRRSR